jgi:uncharacterized membrane protein
VLTIGFALVLMIFVGVVTDASKLFLTRRSLAAVADQAAAAAAQDVDVAAVYRGNEGESLPLSEREATETVQGMLPHAAAGTGLTDLRAVSVTLDGADVVVTLSGRAVLPLTSLVTGATDGVLVTVTARAEAAVAR